MNKIFITTLMACALISCRTESIGISRVVVLDSNFQKRHVIDQSDSINQLNNLWLGFEPLDEVPDKLWTHKLDIESEKLSGRWLYNHEGFLAKLNKQLKPRFKVKDKETFNKLIRLSITLK